MWALPAQVKRRDNDAVVVEDQTENSTTTRKEAPVGVILFEKYRLRKFLGYRAFVKVYEAENVSTGQSVAIKAVSKNKVVKTGLAAHIEREISIMRRLQHPHIIQLFEVLATKTKIYFIMEFARNGDLFQKVANARFDEDLSRRYFQ